MSLESENLYRLETIQKYREIFKDMFRYIPWFEQRMGKNASHFYNGEEAGSLSMSIPVYDSTLLAFIKEMQATGVIDRNYVYVFSRNSIRTQPDEINWIKNAELRNIEDIFGIMAKYILGGMTKGNLWTQAVENGVFYHGLLKIKKLLEIYDGPLA
ncbi:MAG: hypothetical protein HDR71_09210 [Lachnospiraceae bacterium]|nr:hypothetical protein [Lachnospiraceae bacterium]